MTWPAEMLKHSEGMVSAPAQRVKVESVESLLKGSPLYEDFVKRVGSREDANRQIAGVDTPAVSADEGEGQVL